MFRNQLLEGDEKSTLEGDGALNVRKPTVDGGQRGFSYAGERILLTPFFHPA